MVKFLSEYRNRDLAEGIIKKIKSISTKPANFMEVCGTHTVAISKNGIRQVLPENIRLISGPGCPVCVTSNYDIDRMMAILKEPDVIITTFGDMMKVPGSYSSLSREKALGADIRVIYSTLDALKIAKDNPDKKVIFFGVGFETTTPTIAMSIIAAKKQNMKNYYVMSVHKVVPPAMRALLDLGEIKLDGFLCPGHVSMVIGSRPYEPIAADYHIPCVIAGFEPLDILEAVYMMIRQVEEGQAKVEIPYNRVVKPEGNPVAVEAMNEVFEEADADWRGIGTIPGSGLKIRDEYADIDVDSLFPDIEVPPTKEHKGCRCGEVLRGLIYPHDCGLFGKVCTPSSPIGPCMVSSEGSCAAYYRYEAVGQSART